jgi:hypothetical protein
MEEQTTCPQCFEPALFVNSDTGTGTCYCCATELTNIFQEFKSKLGTLLLHAQWREDNNSQLPDDD